MNRAIIHCSPDCALYLGGHGASNEYDYTKMGLLRSTIASSKITSPWTVMKLSLSSTVTVHRACACGLWHQCPGNALSYFLCGCRVDIVVPLHRLALYCLIICSLSGRVSLLLSRLESARLDLIQYCLILQWGVRFRYLNCFNVQ